jgi:predicted unusual protein kinase regulating ubiquinone biosynthesis (AarF/ABC1/UbiB family)
VSPEDKPPTRGKRLLKLAGMSAALAGSYASGRIARTFMSSESARQARKEAAAFAGERIVKTLGELKGAAMKVGQMASMASDLLPPELSSALQSLQKQAPPMAYEVIAEQIEREFGLPVERLFASFDRQPFAAASIGQVHRARTDDGREVVVKVQYPGVDSAVSSDMAHLKLALRAGGLVRIDKQALDAVFDEIKRRMYEELDYCNEADNLRAFQAFHARHPFVVVPSVVGERSAKRVLTLSYEPGDALSDLDALGYTQAERDLCGTHLWACADAQCFEFGRLHADPNPANFAFRRDGSVVLYDFGCVKTLSPDVMPNYVQLVTAGLRRDYVAAEAVLQRMGVRRPGGDPPIAFYALVRDWLATPFMHSESFDFGTAQLERDALRELLPVVVQHIGAFRVAEELVFFNRTIAGLYAVLRKMRARVPVQRMLSDRIPGLDALLGLPPA